MDDLVINILIWLGAVQALLSGFIGYWIGRNWESGRVHQLIDKFLISKEDHP